MIIVKYLDSNYNINISDDLPLGKCIKIILSKLNLLIYYIEYVSIVFTNNHSEIIGDNIQFNTLLSEIQNINYFKLHKQIDNSQLKYINKYLNYIREIEDEEFAKKLQYDTYNNISDPYPEFSLLSNIQPIPIDPLFSTLQSNNLLNITSINLTDNPFTLITQLLDVVNNNNINNQPENVKVVIKEENIDKLKTLKYKNYNGCMDKCHICLELYNHDDTIIQTECKCIFHYDCLIPWIKNESNKCPICRKTIGGQGTPIIKNDG